MNQIIARSAQARVALLAASIAYGVLRVDGPSQRSRTPGGVVVAGKKAEGNVGYGRPPRRTQFMKGRSGNPKGRPKGQRT